MTHCLFSRKNVTIFLLFCISYLCGAQTGDKGFTIVPSGYSNPDSTFVFTVPGNGVFFLINGREMISLEKSEELPTVQFPPSFIVDEVVCTKYGLLVKVASDVFLCKELPILCASFETNDFHLFSCTDDKVFVSTKTNLQSLLYTFDCCSKELSLVSSFNNDIVYAYGSSHELFVVTEYNIYLLSNSKKKKLLSYFEPIRTAVQTEAGLLFATNNSTLILLGTDSFGLIENRGCRKLLSTDGLLYEYYDDGNLVCYKAQVDNL